MSGTDNKSKEAPPQEAAEPSSTRRKLLIAGGAVVTLASQSCLAGACRSPSAFTSGNVSRTSQQQTSCNGNSPGYWKNKPEAWPRPYSPDARFYGTYFNGNQFLYGAGVRYPDATTLTLMDVLQFQGNEDPSKIGFHIIGALLNVAAGLIPPQILTQAELFDMFNQFAVNGVYLPTGNSAVQWGAGQIVYYLTANYIAP